MITLIQGVINSVVLTLTEKSTLVNPTYRMLCENVTTKQTVTIELGTDLSGFKERFNLFTVASTAFLNQESGQWNYTAFENTSNVVVEVGKLQLNKSINFEFKGYDVATTYKAYAG